MAGCGIIRFVREVLVSIHTKFEVSRCLVCPSIAIYTTNQKVSQTHGQTDFMTPRRLPFNNGSLEKWFGWIWIGLAWLVFFVLQFLKVVLVSIHTKFELSKCLVCPTMEMNKPIAFPQNG